MFDFAQERSYKACPERYEMPYIIKVSLNMDVFEALQVKLSPALESQVHTFVSRNEGGRVFP